MRFQTQVKYVAEFICGAVLTGFGPIAHADSVKIPTFDADSFINHPITKGVSPDEKQRSAQSESSLGHLNHQKMERRASTLAQKRVEKRPHSTARVYTKEQMAQLMFAAQAQQAQPSSGKAHMTTQSWFAPVLGPCFSPESTPAATYCVPWGHKGDSILDPYSVDYIPNHPEGNAYCEAYNPTYNCLGDFADTVCYDTCSAIEENARQNGLGDGTLDCCEALGDTINQRAYEFDKAVVTSAHNALIADDRTTATAKIGNPTERAAFNAQLNTDQSTFNPDSVVTLAEVQAFLDPKLSCQGGRSGSLKAQNEPSNSTMALQAVCNRNTYLVDCYDASYGQPRWICSTYNNYWPHNPYGTATWCYQDEDRLCGPYCDAAGAYNNGYNNGRSHCCTNRKTLITESVRSLVEGDVEETADGHKAFLIGTAIPNSVTNASEKLEMQIYAAARTVNTSAAVSNTAIDTSVTSATGCTSAAFSVTPSSLFVVAALAMAAMLGSIY